MEIPHEFSLLLTDLISKWEQFAAESQSPSDGEPGYDQGVAIGFEAAAEELRALLEQVGTPRKPEPADISIEITRQEDQTDAKWEFFYVGLDQAKDGTWRVKHLNGVWQPRWENGIAFNDMVAELSRDGWLLAHFASGIHVFKRRVNP